MHVRSSLIAAIAVTVSLLAPAASQAQSPRGPNPTVASLQATTGPFATQRVSVTDAATGSGFGSATITYPTDTSQGTFGVVAVAPGFTESESAIAWYGPRIASQGFVVITFNTNSRYDQPGSRGDQLLAALDYVRTGASSAVRARVDGSRLAVMGHSMGGGGTLEASKDRPSLKAGIGLTPYDSDKSWPEITVPSMEIGAQNDRTAAPRSHAIPFYESIPASTPKAYLELAGASHSAPTSPNTTIAAGSIAWLKRYVDTDTRYTRFICPSFTAGTAGATSAYRTTCN